MSPAPGEYVYTTEPPFDRPNLGARMGGVFRSTFTAGGEEFALIDNSFIGGFCAKMTTVQGMGRFEPKPEPRSATPSYERPYRTARAALWVILAISLAQAALQLGWIR